MRISILLVTIAACLGLDTVSVGAQDFEAKVRAFSKARQRLANELSQRLDLSLSPDAETFFEVASTGDWKSVSNHFEQVKQQGSYAVPQLRNALWATIHETFGIWEVWVGWKQDSSLLGMFHEPVLASMPNVIGQ
jgi:hypothetical protein